MSGPVPITATVEPAPRRPPAWAAASIPSASPDTMVTPAALSAAAKAAALALPWAVALRLPTMASPGAASNSAQPATYSRVGGA